MQNKKPVSNNKFYMLRCVATMAHADGIVCDAERAYFTAILNRLDTTPEQRKTLLDDLNNGGQDIGDLFRYINEPSFRSQVIYFARLMAYKNGDLHPNEETLLQKIHALTMDGLDMDSIREQVKRAVSIEMNRHDIEMDKNRLQQDGHIFPWFQWFDEFLQSIGIDLLD